MVERQFMFSPESSSMSYQTHLCLHWHRNRGNTHRLTGRNSTFPTVVATTTETHTNTIVIDYEQLQQQQHIVIKCETPEMLPRALHHICSVHNRIEVAWCVHSIFFLISCPSLCGFSVYSLLLLGFFFILPLWWLVFVGRCVGSGLEQNRVRMKNNDNNNLTWYRRTRWM